MIHVTLKGGTVKEYEAGITAADVAKDLGMGLYKAACCCKINGNVCDLRTPLHEDCELAICTFDDEDGKKTFWHTSSHLLAQATAFIMILTSKSRFLPRILKKLRL